MSRQGNHNIIDWLHKMLLFCPIKTCFITFLWRVPRIYPSELVTDSDQLSSWCFHHHLYYHHHLKHHHRHHRHHHHHHNHNHHHHNHNCRLVIIIVIIIMVRTCDVCELQVCHWKVQLISLLPTDHRENDNDDIDVGYDGHSDDSESDDNDDDDCKVDQGSWGPCVKACPTPSSDSLPTVHLTQVSGQFIKVDH